MKAREMNIFEAKTKMKKIETSQITLDIKL